MHFQILLTVLDLSFFPLTFYTPNFPPRSTSSVNWKNHSFSAFFFFFFLQMEDSEQEEEEEEESEEFNVIPPYSEKDSNIESGARGSKRGAASQAVPVLPLLLLLPALIVDWECWSF